MGGSAEQIAKSITALGILSPDDLRASGAGRAASEQDADSFVKSLVAQELLTPFQAKQFLTNRGHLLVVGDYLLLDQIGAGGMGTVYRARHRESGRLVALKLIVVVSKTEEFIARFRREARTVAALQHPGIVRAIDWGECEGRHYFAMELIDGTDLSAALKRQGSFGIAAAVDYVAQAARAMAYAHSQGIIHRDLKPSNLVLDTTGRIKILDLGLARIEDAAAGEDEAARKGLTQTGQVMGTVDYMAPEQAVDVRRADARSDIYSLGCTLFRLISGKTPYAGETVVEKILAHREQPIPSPASRRAGVPPAVEMAVRRALAKRPQDRYQSMEEFAAALEQSLATEATSAIVEPPPRLPPAAIPSLPLPMPVAAPSHPNAYSGQDPVRSGHHAPAANAEPASDRARRRRQTVIIGCAATAALALTYGLIVVVGNTQDAEPSAASAIAAGDEVAKAPAPFASSIEKPDPGDRSESPANEPEVAATVSSTSGTSPPIAAATTSTSSAATSNAATSKAVQPGATDVVNSPSSLSEPPIVAPYPTGASTPRSAPTGAAGEPTVARTGNVPMPTSTPPATAEPTGTRTTVATKTGSSNEPPVKPTAPTLDDLRRTAVDAGLGWLARAQQPKGNWTFAIGPDGPQNKDRESDNGATGLALLALLKAGHAPRVGSYGKEVDNGLNFLLDQQEKVGKGAGLTGNWWRNDKGTMYAHALATLAMIEAAKVTKLKDARYVTSARLAVRFIVFSQDREGGGWRYKPREPGDLSITGWQVQALRRFRDLNIPNEPTDELIDDALELTEKKFLPTVQVNDGRRYRYINKSRIKESSQMSAAGLSTVLELGASADGELIQAGVTSLLGESPTDLAYMDYYKTRLMQQVGGPKWKAWDERITRHLVATQQASQEFNLQGSWKPNGKELLGTYGGRFGYTTFNLLILLHGREQN